MISYLRGKKTITNTTPPADIQAFYDSMINGNRNEKTTSRMDETSTDNGKVNSNEESDVPHKIGTISSDTIRESLSKPLYQVTNRELSADDKVEVVDFSNVEKIPRSNKQKDLFASRMVNKSFMMKDGTILLFDSKTHASHFYNSQNKHKFYKNERERLFSDDELLGKLLENSVYVEKSKSHHESRKDNVLHLFCAIKVGDEFYKYRIIAREISGGLYTIEKAAPYDIYTAGKIETKKITSPKNINPTSGLTTDSLFLVSIADLLNGVKSDDKSTPYVINGELNYDENIFMTKEMLEDKIQKEKFMKDMETSVVKKFPNAKNVSSTVTHISFDMANGSHIDMNTYRDKIYIKPDANSENVDVVNREDLLTLSKEGFDEVPSYAAFELAMSNLSQRERNALNRNFKYVKSIAKAYRQWQVARMNNDGTLYGKTFQRIQDTANSFLKLFSENDKAIISKVKEGKVWESEKNNKSAEKLYNILDKSLEEPLNQMVDISTLKGKVKGKIKETVKGRDHNNDHITVREREK